MVQTWVSNEVTVMTSASEGMTRTGFIPKIIYSYGWQMGPGCLWDAPMHHHVDLLHCLNNFMTWQLASSRVSDPRETKVATAMSIML